MKPWIRHTWPYAVAVSVCASGLCYVAMGATYNFYFNNTEQGANSTATPNLTVHSDGTVSGATNSGMPGTQNGTPPGTYPAQEAGVPPGTVPPPPGMAPPVVPQTATAVYSQSATAVSQEEPEQKPKKKHWRLIADVLETRETQTYTNSYASGYYPTSTGDATGMAIELGLHLGRFWTLNSFIGAQQFPGGSVDYAYATAPSTTAFGGLEFELTPIRLTLFSAEDFLELSVLAGASTLGAVNGNVATLHYGGRLAMNFTPSFGLVATVRANDAYTMGSAGAVFHF